MFRADRMMAAAPNTHLLDEKPRRRMSTPPNREVRRGRGGPKTEVGLRTTISIASAFSHRGFHNAYRR